MKTYYLLSRRLPLFSLLGILAITITSCGSYQNSSYYDGDGVYGNGENKKRETASNDNSQSDKYQEYFSDLNKDAQSFTNVESYSSVPNDSVANNTQTYNDNNSGWGSNPQSVTVNVYDSNWGYGYWNNYWGWNSWYGPSWGWGWNSWYGPSWSIGWGGWYNPWYYGGWYSPWGYYGGYYGGYYNNYYHYHNGGRRGGAYGYTANRYNNGSRSGYGIRNNSGNVIGGRRDNAIGTRSSSFNPTRSNSSFNPTRSNTVRNYTNTNTNSSPRPNTNSSSSQPRGNVRSESAPTRSYSPSNSNYGGGRSSSGGGGGGSYGGGRSSGGGGRR